jgi:hypothetical protein
MSGKSGGGTYPLKLATTDSIWVGIAWRTKRKHMC